MFPPPLEAVRGVSPGMTPKYVVVFIWFVWAVSSTVTASTTVAPVIKAAGWRRELPYRLLMGLGFTLMFVSLGQSSSPVALPPLRAAILSFGFADLWTLPQAALWGCAVLAAAGLALGWWARAHLGGLWSSGVTRKQDHRLIDSGPYAFVRHPIYAGLLLGAVALLGISGRTFGVLGFGLLVIGLILKARLEERFLREELGADVYAAYAKRVPMLVPGSPV
jgi:protein-S-isoprenylcysteine O-methyltransferase Ste14